jgi:glucosamine-6-phosphate deaminase
MRFVLTNDYESMSRAAADLVIRQVTKKPDLVACFPTGGTPVRMYELLVEACRKGDVDFSRVTVLSVDDYVGLPPEHEQSYFRYLHTQFFDHCNFNQSKILLIDTMAADMEAECTRYNQLIRDCGGLDLVVDGIGENGHIGFNEPSDHMVLGMHLERVSDWTARVNSRFFHNVHEVPKYAVTIGIDDMLKARTLLVMSNGPKKAAAFDRLLKENTITTEFPASFLKLADNAVIILDKESAADNAHLVV